jgi:hypothetical protein
MPDGNSLTFKPTSKHYHHLVAGHGTYIHNVGKKDKSGKSPLVYNPKGAVSNQVKLGMHTEKTRMQAVANHHYQQIFQRSTGAGDLNKAAKSPGFFVGHKSEGGSCEHVHGTKLGAQRCHASYVKKYPEQHKQGGGFKIYKYSSEKSLTTNQGADMDFEQIFKSDIGAHSCPNCGEGLLIAKSEDGLIIKGRKKGKKKGKLDIGNQMEPHKGGKTGSFIPAKAKGASQGKGVQRRATQPGNPTTEKSLFPLAKSFAAVRYDGTADADFAKSVEEDGVPGLSSPRNLVMEQAQSLRKGPPPPKGDDEGEEESSEVTSDEESSTDDDSTSTDE